MPTVPPDSVVMLALSAHSPFSLRPGSSAGEAVERALAEAGSVSGGYAGPPCAFRALGRETEALLEALRPRDEAGQWVLVTAQHTGEMEHRVHLRERSLTAAQRFMLALACDDIDSQWVAAVPTTAAFSAAGVDLDGHVPVGLVWCSGGA